MRNIITRLGSDFGGTSAVEDGIMLGIFGVVLVYAWPYVHAPIAAIGHAIGHFFGLT